MPALSSSQLVARACATAHVPAWVQQGGQYLNIILDDLCQQYDLDLAKGTFNFNFSLGIVANPNFINIQAGSGPYALPLDFLRANKDECIWFNQGVPYPLIAVDISEYDWQVQQAGNQNYPYLVAIDLSQIPPVAVVWPGAGGAFPVMLRYQRQMPAIGSGGPAVNGWNPGSLAPEVSPVIPWFPNQSYLLKALAGKLCEEADDTRAQTFLGDGDPNNPGAGAILRAYLKQANDNSDRAKRVTLDRRRFKHRWSSLPDTKRVGF